VRWGIFLLSSETILPSEEEFEVEEGDANNGLHTETRVDDDDVRQITNQRSYSDWKESRIQYILIENFSLCVNGRKLRSRFSVVSSAMEINRALVSVCSPLFASPSSTSNSSSDGKMVQTKEEEFPTSLLQACFELFIIAVAISLFFYPFFCLFFWLNEPLTRFAFILQCILPVFREPLKSSEWKIAERMKRAEE